MPNIGECSHLEYYGNDDNASSIMQISVAQENISKVSTLKELKNEPPTSEFYENPIQKHKHKLCGHLGAVDLSNTDLHSVETKELMSQITSKHNIFDNYSTDGKFQIRDKRDSGGQTYSKLVNSTPKEKDLVTTDDYKITHFEQNFGKNYDTNKVQKLEPDIGKVDVFKLALEQQHIMAVQQKVGPSSASEYPLDCTPSTI